MANTEARREARLRKIIENANSRMEKLNSLMSKKLDAIPLDNFNVDESDKFDDCLNVNKPSLNTLFQNGNYSSELTSNVKTLPNKKENKNVKVIVLMGLGIFINILQVVSLKLFNSNENGSNLTRQVFTPFLLYEIIDVFMLKRNDEMSGLSNILALFANIPQNVSSKIVTVINVITTIIQDLLIYFFMYAVVNLFIHIIVL